MEQERKSCNVEPKKKKKKREQDKFGECVMMIKKKRIRSDKKII